MRMLAEQRRWPIGLGIVVGEMERCANEAQRAAGRVYCGLDQAESRDLRIGEDAVDRVDGAAGYLGALQHRYPVVSIFLSQPAAHQLLDLHSSGDALVILRIPRILRQLGMADGGAKALPLSVIPDRQSDVAVAGGEGLVGHGVGMAVAEPRRLDRAH